MKISCLQENLAKGLSVVGRAVGTRSTLPQASHVLLASDEGRLKLVATNLEIAITCWIGAQVEEEGAVTIPARLLTDFVTSLPNERIDMSLPARAKQLNLTCARNEASVSGMDAADFPPVPPVDDGFRLKLDAKALRAAIEHVEFAAAADDTRPVLPGSHASRALIDMRQFLQETRIAAIFARDGSGIVRIQLQPGEDVAPGKLIISARTEEIGEHRGEM